MAVGLVARLPADKRLTSIIGARGWLGTHLSVAVDVVEYCIKYCKEMAITITVTTPRKDGVEAQKCMGLELVATSRMLAKYEEPSSLATPAARQTMRRRRRHPMGQHSLRRQQRVKKQQWT